MAKATAKQDLEIPADKVWELVTDGNRLTSWLSPVLGVDSVDPASASLNLSLASPSLPMVASTCEPGYQERPAEYTVPAALGVWACTSRL